MEEKKDKILYELARYHRNVDGVYPTNLGARIGNCLMRLRNLDPAKYDELVLKKENSDE